MIVPGSRVGKRGSEHPGVKLLSGGDVYDLMPGVNVTRARYRLPMPGAYGLKPADGGSFQGKIAGWLNDSATVNRISVYREFIFKTSGGEKISRESAQGPRTCCSGFYQFRRNNEEIQ